MKKFSRGKMIAFLFSLCLLLAACGYGEVEKENSGSGDKQHYTITVSPGAGSLSASSYAGLKDCDIELIRLLAASYYSALKSSDVSQLSPLVTDSGSLGEDVFSGYENVESVNVKHLYMLEGDSPIDYVIYVYYELKLEGIDTPVPSLDELYVSSSSGGSYYIINGPVSASAYNNVLQRINAAAGIDDLVTFVNIQFEDAIRNDEALRLYLEALPSHDDTSDPSGISDPSESSDPSGTSEPSVPSEG